MRPTFLIFSGLLAAALSCAPVFAADKPAKAAKPAAAASAAKAGAFLTRDELRACMKRKAELAEQDTALVKEQADLATTKTELTTLGDTLKDQLPGIDRTNAEAVNAYNDQLRARDQRIDAYQARAGVFNTRVEAAQTERESYAKDCAQRRYLEDDETAIKKGK